MTISSLLKNLSFKNGSNNKFLLNSDCNYNNGNENKFGNQEVSLYGGFSYSPKGITPH
ncbi:hypothetical protein RB653_007370 [Dictyostelium firmibasis]|uniref:Uncharacterized protein n=1 Tax=Dictyostelium firmibasis TaxID=79012 RepID=A0AAN7YLZ9_9MYCE